MSDKNIIPAVFSAGSFEASSPFDRVIDPDIYYTVEAVRTINEMQIMKMDLYTLMFEPIGVTKDDYPTVLDRAKSIDAVVVVLTARNKQPVYVLSSYLKSFPMVDGVSYERMCLVADLGPLPPAMKEVLAQTIEHIKQYVQATVGVTADVKLGTIPTIGYVTREQADIFENARKSKITDTDNDVAKVRQLENQLIEERAYSASLEEKIP